MQDEAGLVTESRHPASHDLDAMSATELVALMQRSHREAVDAVERVGAAVARAIELVAARLAAGGRLLYVGAGTSGRLGVLDAAECPPTFGTDPTTVVAIIAGGERALRASIEGAEDDAEAGVRAVTDLAVGARDVVVGLAASGRTPFVLGAIAAARQANAATIGVGCNPAAPLVSAVDLPITPLVGPEILTGSTRLKAGTAQKLVLNAISTGAMVRNGKTYGNWMVDLRATNDKLRARALRIVSEVTGLDRPAAARALAACDGELKTCLVAHLAAVAPAVARVRLAAHGGRVRAALEGTR